MWKNHFNEDMIYAADLIHAGYGIAYAADAKLFILIIIPAASSFTGTLIRVSQAQYPEIFDGVHLREKDSAW